MKNDYTMARIRESWTPEKRDGDGPWTRYVLRPLSFYAARFFLGLGWSANAVTILGALLSILGFIPLAWRSLAPGAGPGAELAVYGGFFLFFLFGVLDYADGNMARTVGTGSSAGEWLDAVGGYLAYTALLLGMGAVQGSAIYMLAAGAAASANLLMRLAFQSFRSMNVDAAAKSAVGGEKKFSETIGITGFLVPLAVIGYATGLLGWVILAYAGVYGGGAVIVLVKLVRKIEAADKKD